MTPCTPTIVGPLSELSSSIRVQGLLPGATVTITSIGPNQRPLAKKVQLSTSDERVDLLPGVSLDRNDRLVAIQELNGETSSPTPDQSATAIQPAPASAAEIGHVSYETHLYECGDALFISGAIPGALVQTVFHGSVQGSGVGFEGDARYRLSSKLSLFELVSTFQSAPGLPPGPTTDRTPDPFPLPFGDSLPPPTIGDPLKACQSAVSVQDVIDGATVTVTRDTGRTESAPFDLSSMWFNLSQPLVEGEHLTVTQSFLKCEQVGRTSERTVGPAQPVEVPHISGRLCAGMSWVPVDGLIPDANVQIILGNGKTFLGHTPRGVTSHTFELGETLFATFMNGDQPVWQTVTVRQERCDIWGDSQWPPVPVDEHADITVKPAIVGPLYDCATRVFVTDIHPNAQVLVLATRNGGTAFPISNVVTIPGASGSIQVRPALHAPDDVFVAEWACGRRLESEPIPVWPHPRLDMLGIEGYIHHLVYEGATSVVVLGAVSGALIELYVSEGNSPARRFLSRATAGGSGKTRVDLGRALRPDERLWARQWLCGDASLFNDSVKAVKIPDLETWLNAHPDTANAIIWEAYDPHPPFAAWQVSLPVPYPSWGAAMKGELATAFALAWNFGSVMHVDPVPNMKTLADADEARQLLGTADAVRMFLAYVAQSLVVEIGGLVGWSITGYSATGLAQLFDSRETFVWVRESGDYEIQLRHGVALPGAPDVAFRFLIDMIASDRPSTISRVLDWCRNLHHFGGTDEQFLQLPSQARFATLLMNDHWQYRGFPPVSRMIEGTPILSQGPSGITHSTAGCWGTVGFLRAVLRTVNIPVQLVFPTTHALPHFVEDGLYLSHGDDPYNSLTTTLMTGIPPMPMSELLIDQAQFDAWFGYGVPVIMRQQNTGRGPRELLLKYLPSFLLKLYCADGTGHDHNTGAVYACFKTTFKVGGVEEEHADYTVAELEALHLWEHMDTKIASLGGCGHF